MAGKVQTAARPERQAGRPAGTQDIREQQMPKKKKKARHFYDYSLLFCIIFLTSFGLVMIYSASSYSAQLNYKGNGAYFMERQAMIAAAGFVGMLIISKIDYHIFARFSVAAYLMSYILMIAVSFVGKEVNGKKRWLPLGPFSFQPTEFVKIALIVLLAAMITTMGMKINIHGSSFFLHKMLVNNRLMDTHKKETAKNIISLYVTFREANFIFFTSLFTAA